MPNIEMRPKQDQQRKRITIIPGVVDLFRVFIGRCRFVFSIVMGLACFLSLVFIAPVLSDEVLVKNGDVLHGHVVSMFQEKLIFKTPYAGEIAIKWDEVIKITTEKAIQVQLKDERVVKGRAISSGENTLTLKLKDGQKLFPSFWQR